MGFSRDWAGQPAHLSSAAAALSLARRVMVAFAVTAAAVESYQAPPAILLLVDLHFQMPTASRLTHS